MATSRFPSDKVFGTSSAKSGGYSDTNWSEGPVSQLEEKDACVFVPERTKPRHIDKLKTLLEQVSSLENVVARMEFQNVELPLRSMLDDVREKLLGRPLSLEERGEAWNVQLQQMADLNGLTKEAAMLTSFENATHHFPSKRGLDILAIAFAVTKSRQHGTLYRELFKFAYDDDADEIVSTELGEKEEVEYEE